MNRKILGLILAAAALALPWVERILPTPTPTPTPAPVNIPASISEPLKAGFVGSKQDAGYWSGLLYGMARTIDMDKSHPGGPRLKTMFDIASLRDWVVACPPAKLAKGEIIGQAIGPELTKIGTGEELIDQDDRRSKVVAVFDQAANVLEGLAK